MSIFITSLSNLQNFLYYYTCTTSSEATAIVRKKSDIILILAFTIQHGTVAEMFVVHNNYIKYR